MSLPKPVLITKYDEFRRLVRKFTEGEFNFLLIEAPPGQGKSVIAETLVANTGVILDNAAASAIGLFMELQDHVDQPIVLSDVDELLKGQGKRILAALTETKEVKTIQWLKQNAALEKAGYERSFQTRSRLLMISNDIETLAKRIPAILSRAMYRRFVPDRQDMRVEAACWVGDQEIFDLWSLSLPFGGQPDFRTITKAKALKDAKEEWTIEILKETDLDALDTAILRSLSVRGRDYPNHADILRELLAAGVKVSSKTFYRRIKKILDATAWVIPMRVSAPESDKMTNPSARPCRIVADEPLLVVS